MKSFLDHLKEEVLPTVQVADGGLDISKPAVRAAINAAIAGVVSQPAVTPYVVFNRLSKLLAQYHIILPKRFLEGDKGVEVFELRQFGHKMGMTDSGEFINEVPSTHYLFLQYGILSPFGITYAKPVVGGMFKVMARLVDKEELDKLMDMAEITMAEEAEQMQAIAKANAPRDEMHDITSDEKKKGNKAAVATSEKKSLDEEYEKVEAGVKKRRGETHTLHRRNPGHKTEYHTITTERDGRKSVKTGSPKYIKKHWDKMEEDTLDEVSLAKAAKTARLRNIGAERSAHASPYDYSPHIDVQRRKAGKTVDRIGLKHGDDKAKKVSDKMSKDTDKVWRGKMGEDKDPCWKGYEMIGMKKKGGRKVPNCVPVEEATDKDRDLSKLASAAMSKGQAVKKLPAGRAQNAVLPKGMARGANIEKGRWSGHGKFDEETQLDELTGKGKLPALKSVYKGDKDYHSRSADYHAARADRAERRGEDSKAERHMDAGYGHEHKAERAEAKSKRASALMVRAKAHADIKSSKAASKSAKAEYNEETQLDELSKDTLRSYVAKRGSQLSSMKYGPDRGGKSLTGRQQKNAVIGIKRAMKEEQIDELKKSTVGSYLKKAHVSGLAAADDAASAYHRRDYKELHKANKTGEKRESGVNLAADKLSGRARVAANEETIAEKAPPGAKFERMVKHIKKGYAEKDGLSKKEKSIAYATAWKAKNREKGE